MDVTHLSRISRKSIRSLNTKLLIYFTVDLFYYYSFSYLFLFVTFYLSYFVYSYLVIYKRKLEENRPQLFVTYTPFRLPINFDDAWVKFLNRINIIWVPRWLENSRSYSLTFPGWSQICEWLGVHRSESYHNTLLMEGYFVEGLLMYQTNIFYSLWRNEFPSLSQMWRWLHIPLVP